MKEKPPIPLSFIQMRTLNASEQADFSTVRYFRHLENPKKSL